MFDENPTKRSEAVPNDVNAVSCGCDASIAQITIIMASI